MGTPPVDTILVVDDDEVVVSTFERMLTVGGYRVLTALSSEEALRQLDESRPDALVLDVRMPRVNGLGLLYRIRAREPYHRLPVLIVTGIPLNDEMLDELAALGGKIRYKPIGAAELLADIRLLLSER
jgi:DNA-binding response OmpR family regulator